ncbi:hypothetical protein BHE90_013012 [Fusarium euwallaceae]|uniref:Uncharacterized protein n=1 Tax=Fusarium euwallaceae TaxID=1147111 RepID=A0A430LA07_9HYPO|nr:hypothetical protein BHE90_013012 [Fusarium euwallaceae]
MTSNGRERRPPLEIARGGRGDRSNKSITVAEKDEKNSAAGVCSPPLLPPFSALPPCLLFPFAVAQFSLLPSQPAHQNPLQLFTHLLE